MKMHDEMETESVYIENIPERRDRMALLWRGTRRNVPPTTVVSLPVSPLTWEPAWPIAHPMKTNLPPHEHTRELYNVYKGVNTQHFIVRYWLDSMVVCVFLTSSACCA